MERDVMWSALAWPGMEQLSLRIGDEGITADSLLLGVFNNQAYRASYHIQLDQTWTVRQVRLSCSAASTGVVDRSASGSGASIELHADGAGNWTNGNGEPVPDLAGAIDIDISATPFTNSLPMHRLGISSGQTQEITVAYLALPDLTTSTAGQRYSCLQTDASGSIYRFESRSTGFQAEIMTDLDGLVTEYPRLFTRVWSS